MAITGIGMVTPLGVNAETSWRAICAGRSGIRRIRGFDPRGLDARIAGEVPGYRRQDRWRPRRGPPLDRRTAFALDAVAESLRMAGIEPGSALLARAAVVFGAEVSRPRLEGRRVRKGSEDAWPIRYLENAPHVATSRIAERTGVRGHASTVSMACASSAAAVAEALALLRSGEAELAVVGGTDAQVDPLGMAMFGSLGVLSRRNDAPGRASRPFDVARDGFVMGEGAGAVVLETKESAQRRGVPVLAELAGAGVSANAYRITDSPADGVAAADAMRSAIRDAGLRPTQIGYVNAHGTATLDNDVSEARAIRRCFGSHAARVAVSSTKSMTGHLIAAAGIVEMIFTALAVHHGLLPPTRNLETADPHCSLRHVRGRALPEAIVAAVSNSFAFGGTNVSLVIARAEA